MPAAATAPALIVVGFFMITIVKDIPWDITRGIGYGFAISFAFVRII